MEIIETENGLYVMGTNSILQAQGFASDQEDRSPADRHYLYAQVGSRDGVAWVWLSSRPGEPDALPEVDQ